MKSLLESGVDACCPMGETVLYRASKAGVEHIVQYLLEAGAETETAGSSSRRPLYAACEGGYTQIVDLLLQHGADPNALVSTASFRVPGLPLFLRLGVTHLLSSSSSSQDLPICCAVKKGYSDIVELLMKHGADANKKDQLGKSALIYSIESLTSSVRKTSDVVGPLEEKNRNILRCILLATGDVNKLSDHNGHNALHVASFFGMCDVMMELIERGANCNQLTSSGKSALDLACENGHEAAVEMLLKNGAKPDRETATTYPHSSYAMPVLCTAAKNGSEMMVKMLLQYGADVNASDKRGNTALFVAVEAENTDIITSLLNAGASVNATDHEGRNAACFAAENLTSYCSYYYYSTEKMSNSLATIRLLLQHGGNFKMLLPDGHSPLLLVVRVLPTVLLRGDTHKAIILELLLLMVEHGAMLLDSSSQLGNVTCQPHSAETLAALATFGGKHKFIVDLLRAGAGFQLIASCCSAVSTTSGTVKSLAMGQAVVLAGYKPSAEELVHLLQLAASNENVPDGLQKQLVDWLNDERQQVPSLIRQCRVAIRRQLSTATQYRTILPAIDQLPLPNKLKLYLQFDGSLTEVDLSIEQQTIEETLAEERELQIAYELYNSGHNSFDSDYDYRYDYYYDVYDSDSARYLWW